MPTFCFFHPVVRQIGDFVALLGEDEKSPVLAPSAAAHLLRSVTMARIRIDDLPITETFTPEEQSRSWGPGGPRSAPPWRA
jgi:hypothetical protein